MHMKTMEGLVGSSASIKMMETPIRIYKEARRREDTAVMERAMGYVDDFAREAEEYKGKTEEGMKKEAEEAKKQEKETREKAIEKQQEKNERQERIKTEGKSDSAEISEEGKQAAAAAAKEIDGTEPVIYTKTGEAQKAETEPGISILA